MLSKIFLSLFLLSTSSLGASPVTALQDLIGFGTFKGQTESGESCTLEINRLTSGNVRIFLFNPRVNQFEFSVHDHYEVSSSGVRITLPPEFEDNARITNSLVLEGRIVGIEREFCTYKCWVSMRPCILDPY